MDTPMGRVEMKEKLLSRSGRLFATPSFITGVAKAIDLGATFDEYNADVTPEEADFYSLLSDWCAVGDDLRFAITLYELQASK